MYALVCDRCGHRYEVDPCNLESCGISVGWCSIIVRYALPLKTPQEDVFNICPDCQEITMDLPFRLPLTAIGVEVPEKPRMRTSIRY
jgi:hypothetical protein